METGKINNHFLENLLYAIAIILVIICAAGYIIFGNGGVMQIIFIIALVAILIRFMQGKRL